MATTLEKPVMEIAKDQREFIEICKRTGDVVIVDKQVDWDLELGAISRHATEIDGPAVVFNNIKDYPSQSMFVNPISTWLRAASMISVGSTHRLSVVIAPASMRAISRMF